MSSEVLFLHRCLLSSVPDSTHSVDCSMDGEPDCEALLASIQKKLYKNALCTVRQLRQRYGREFGCCEQVEVEVLLLAYCRAHHDACWALIGSHKALSVDCAQLREANMQMGGTVRSLAPEAIALRSSRVSSASESYSRV
ncbi:hypothetical protein AB6A40_010436 [Gnathostoma spinigerum]|uniref:Protein furry C-terminal domain-containing protein n=1 Tax=Gnathostoma spinigerum TaxID=75299 RepID=A0ABD6EX93_9BILA